MPLHVLPPKANWPSDCIKHFSLQVGTGQDRIKVEQLPSREKFPKGIQIRESIHEGFQPTRINVNLPMRSLGASSIVEESNLENLPFEAIGSSFLVVAGLRLGTC